MITLTLLHPIQSIPVQSWTFEQEPVIRIGRSTDNHVILYSAVVSRHHVELRQVDAQWEIVNLGANGTYLDGKRITQVPVEDGVIIRLARSGPNIQIHVGQSVSAASKGLNGENTLAQRIRSRAAEKAASVSPVTSGQPSQAEDPPLPVTSQPEPDNQAPSTVKQPTTAVDAENPSKSASVSTSNSSPSAQNLSEEQLFCQDSGQPLKVLQTVVEYQVVKTLRDDGIKVTQVVWRNGQSLLLTTLSPEWLRHPKALEVFEAQSKSLLQLSHPGIPRFVDYFVAAGQPYLVSEWVHGQDLKQQVKKKGVLSREEAIATLLQVCDVLDYLHHQPLPFVHQDIRPENLIQRASSLNPYAIAVVGFASLKDLVVGTHLSASGYTAPEQQQGNPIPASDLYSLGATLVYLLTGKEPVEFYAQREQGFRLYPEYIPNLIPEMMAIIRKLTNLQPDDRFGSARELADMLAQLVD